MSTTPITVLDHASFEVTLTPGIVEDEQFVKRDGQTLVGVAASSITAGIATTSLAIRTTTGPTDLTIAAVADNEVLTRSGTTIDGVAQSAMTVGNATLAATATTALAITTTTGPTVLVAGAIADADITTRVGSTFVGITRQALADAMRSLYANPVTPVNAATYTWTTAKSVGITYADGTCDITLPDESAQGLLDWPVGEARSLFKVNTSVNVIGFTALTNVGFNLAAVNTAITTLIGSATVPGIATAFPCWTILRFSNVAYYFMQGV